MSGITERDIETIVERVSEAILPSIARSFERVELRLTAVETDLAEFRADTERRFDSLERKLDAEIAWRDDADRRITRLEHHLDLPPLDPR